MSQVDLESLKCANISSLRLRVAVVPVPMNNSTFMTQTHKRFKRMLIYYDIDNTVHSCFTILSMTSKTGTTKWEVSSTAVFWRLSSVDL